MAVIALAISAATLFVKVSHGFTITQTNQANMRDQLVKLEKDVESTLKAHSDDIKKNTAEVTELRVDMATVKTTLGLKAGA